MTRIFVTSVVLVFLLACTVKVDKGNAAVTDPEKEKINSQCDAFMQAFYDDNIEDAMQMLKKHSLIDHDMVDTLHAQIVDQRANFLSYGKPNGFDFVQEKKVKDFVAKRLYVIRYAKTYLPFSFTLFKSAYGWKIIHFRYSPDLQESLFQ